MRFLSVYLCGRKLWNGSTGDELSTAKETLPFLILLLLADQRATFFPNLCLKTCHSGEQFLFFDLRIACEKRPKAKCNRSTPVTVIQPHETTGTPCLGLKIAVRVAEFLRSGPRV